MDYKEEQMILAFKWRAKMTGNLINKLMENNKDKNEDGIFEELGLPTEIARYCLKQRIN
jgi:hypothetical protein